MKAHLISPHNPFAFALKTALRKRDVSIKYDTKQTYSGPIDCDIVIIKSFRERERQIIADYPDVPVFVFDWGYFKRVNSPADHRTGYWQLSYNQLNSLPWWDCPSDRFAASGATLRLPTNDPDGYALVCGQMPGDAAVMGTNHKQWLIDQIEHYESQGFDVRYRPHPRGDLHLDYPRAADSLTDALQGARFVVTYNSNVGHEALLTGVPVVCDPCAPYSDLSGRTLTGDRLKYFSRAAYGQWKVSEAQQAVDFLLDEWMKRI